MFRPVFHLCAATINAYTILYDQLYIVLPLPAKELEDLPLQSRSMFLTMWCLIMQTIFYCIAFMNDIFGSEAKSSKRAPIIRKIKDTLFSLAFPVAIYVSLAFWSIYAVDKQLIFPDHIERLYPKWVNHVMHTTVAIFIIIELLSSYRSYPSRATGFFIIIAFNCSYILWMFVIYMRTGVWVYPIFDHLNWFARAIFITASVCVALTFYILGEKLNSMVCSSTSSPQETYANGKSKSR
ncbi:androgen-induced gene 1 protein-like [Epargyreus clarus]|uniref:androgen-induced gene 1 protein-like n=1 Tax=Epargyreus clarus TaxID=520877 RepID=UPI003C2E1A5D